MESAIAEFGKDLKPKRRAFALRNPQAQILLVPSGINRQSDVETFDDNFAIFHAR